MDTDALLSLLFEITKKREKSGYIEKIVVNDVPIHDKQQISNVMNECTSFSAAFPWEGALN